MEISAFMVGTGRQCIFRKGVVGRERGRFPHLYLTYMDLVEEISRVMDLDTDGFDGKVWSTQDGPLCGGSLPSQGDMDKLRRFSRSHSARVRFDYPSYVLFVVPNTYADKVEVFFLRCAP